MYFLDIIVVKKHLKYGQHLLKQAFNSIDGTVVPYWSLKKFFNYHNRVFPDAQICAFWRMFSTNDPLNELTLRNTGRTQFASQYELIHSHDLQGSNQNVARDTPSQYGDHYCEIVVKSDFK